ncbi:hypothetical protein IG631_14324 [Alternaria alternata]|nr:hypothetical protein IG631_14324 [Alternaria alternata]
MIWYRLLTPWQVERDHVGRLSVVEGGFANRLPELRSQWLDSGRVNPISKLHLNHLYNYPERCRALNTELLGTIPQRSSPLLASELSCELDAGPIPVLILRRSLDSTRIIFTGIFFWTMDPILGLSGGSPSYGRGLCIVLALYYATLAMLHSCYTQTVLVRVFVLLFTVIGVGEVFMMLFPVDIPLTWLAAFVTFLTPLPRLVFSDDNGRSKDGLCRTIFRCVRAPDQVSDSDGHC